VKIVALSDTHGMHREVTVPDGDILICAGDITGRGTMLEVIDFNNWLSSLSHRTKIVIAGNHDEYLTKGRDQSQILLDEAIYLENQQFYTPEGLSVWGSPYTLRFMNWYFMEEESKINRYWEMIPKDTDILITHGPCFGILDELPLKGHLGCEKLTERVKMVAPKLHIFGHIHGAYGVTKIEDTIYVNCSICNEGYLPVNKPVEIDI